MSKWQQPENVVQWTVAAQVVPHGGHYEVRLLASNGSKTWFYPQGDVKGLPAARREARRLGKRIEPVLRQMFTDLRAELAEIAAHDAEVRL